jgi:hypothetical protein
MTGFSKRGGPLSKCIYFDENGELTSNSDACQMIEGSAQRFQPSDVHALADVISKMKPEHALALGALRRDLPDRVEIATKRRIDVLRARGHHNGEIARTRENILYLPQAPAMALLGFDTKGMPDHVRTRLNALGGFKAAIYEIIPQIASCATVERASTSAGLIRSDTGERLNGSEGTHLYAHVNDGTDIERFLTTLHQRCWLAGLGWMMVGAGGQLLERSIVDRMVGASERLIFEGPPILGEGLTQDLELRRPKAHDGDGLDTREYCLPLTIVEWGRFKKAKSAEIHRVASRASRAREAFITARIEILRAAGLAEEQARATVERQCAGVLRPDIVLPWDDPELDGYTVGNVLANPRQFEGETLADPLEGVEYGRGKARIMIRQDGTPWIHSFAHDRTVYELRRDATSVRAAVNKADKSDHVKVLTRLVPDADLTKDETAELVRETARFSGIPARDTKAALKDRTEKIDAERTEERRMYQLAQRTDPREWLIVPLEKEAIEPVVKTLDCVFSESKRLEPPMRNLHGAMIAKRRSSPLNMHALASDLANAEDANDSAKRPAPPHIALVELTAEEVALLVEQHIEYVDVKGTAVHLPSLFIRHYIAYVHGDQTELPTIGAVVNLPIVLADGSVLSGNDGRGIDRERNILFDIPKEIIRVLPQRHQCTPQVVAKAMTFLTDEWLCDVLTDYHGKCVIIANALSLIERTAFPERPVFWVTAARRGSGKTTVLNMIVVAVLGVRAAGASWSFVEEERRKALLGYLMNGAPYIIWDNIKRGSQLSCPHIERCCTLPEYEDRLLGVNQIVKAPTNTIQTFTGNSIAPKGDLASRSLRCELSTDRPDPENRDYDHPDPITWTQEHRAEVLGALYTVLLANPTLLFETGRQMDTRFPAWQRLVGTAVEFAAKMAKEQGDPNAVEISFAKLFAAQDEEDEEGNEFAQALIIIWTWVCEMTSKPFSAAQVEAFINTPWDDNAAKARQGTELRDILFGGQMSGRITARRVSWKLRAHLDEPIRYSAADPSDASIQDEVITLKATQSRSKATAEYWIDRRKA